MKTIFLSPKLEGPRFKNNSIPLDILKDLAVLEELIIEIAKWLYLKENPKRKRVLRGFTDSFILRLSKIDPGSAIPQIEREYPSMELPMDYVTNKDDYFDRARDRCLEVIDAASKGNVSFADIIDRNLLGYFDRIGSSLKKDERMILISPSKEKPVNFDQNTRKRLVLATLEEYSENAEIRGTIVDVYVENLTYKIKLSNDSQLQGRYLHEIENKLIDALKGHEKVRVLVNGIVAYDKNNAPKKIDQTKFIEVLENNDVIWRIDELKHLKDGWLDGEGTAPETDKLNWFVEKWESHYPQNLELPYIFPTHDGGIQLEWSHSTYEISLEINLTKKNASFLATNKNSKEVTSKDLNLTSESDWNTLIALIKKHNA